LLNPEDILIAGVVEAEPDRLINTAHFCSIIY
jgi:hypothetical protein